MAHHQASVKKVTDVLATCKSVDIMWSQKHCMCVRLSPYYMRTFWCTGKMCTHDKVLHLYNLYIAKYLQTSLAFEYTWARITSGAIQAYVPATLMRVVCDTSRAKPKSVIFSVLLFRSSFSIGSRISTVKQITSSIRIRTQILVLILYYHIIWSTVEWISVSLFLNTGAGQTVPVINVHSMSPLTLATVIDVGACSTGCANKKQSFRKNSLPQLL